jgi:hypothetical protein
MERFNDIPLSPSTRPVPAVWAEVVNRLFNRGLTAVSSATVPAVMFSEVDDVLTEGEPLRARFTHGDNQVICDVMELKKAD